VLDAILKSNAVSFEDERLDVADLVLLGLITGAWGRFERDVSRGLALERDGLGNFDAAELKARATAFRYAHRLVSASEFRSWLAARSLTVTDLSGVLGRALRRERMNADDRGAPEGELARVLRAEALCCGVFEELADSAVERMAATHRLGCLGSEVDDERVEATLADALRCRAAGLPSLGEDELARRLRRLWAHEDARALLRTQVSEPGALRRRLDDHGLDWLRLDGWRLRFAAEDAAREARALITDDGLGVDQVSAVSGVVATAESLYLDQVPKPLAGVLAAAAQGEVVAPWLADDEWNVLVVSAKTAPSPEDRVLCERATDELLADVLRRQAAGRARVHGAF
jgi:hypothetical protein